VKSEWLAMSKHQARRMACHEHLGKLDTGISASSIPASGKRVEW
jgi:hypothetical protein